MPQALVEQMPRTGVHASKRARRQDEGVIDRHGYGVLHENAAVAVIEANKFVKARHSNQQFFIMSRRHEERWRQKYCSSSNLCMKKMTGREHVVFVYVKNVMRYREVCHFHVALFIRRVYCLYVWVLFITVIEICPCPCPVQTNLSNHVRRLRNAANMFHAGNRVHSQRTIQVFKDILHGSLTHTKIHIYTGDKSQQAHTYAVLGACKIARK